MVESIVGCKWSVRLLQLCADGPVRPGAALRACPGLSAKVMNERWRKMLRFGLVDRVVAGKKPPLEVEYRLTALGRRFLRILDEVRRVQEELDRGALRADPARSRAVPVSGATQLRPSSGPARHAVASTAAPRARAGGAPQRSVGAETGTEDASRR